MKHNQNDVYLHHLNIFNCPQFLECENDRMSSTGR